MYRMPFPIFARRDSDRRRLGGSRIIFPRRNRRNDRQRTRDRSRPTYIPFITPRLSLAAAFIKLYLDPLPRGIRRGIPSVNAGSTIPPPWRISAVLAPRESRNPRIPSFFVEIRGLAAASF